MKLCVVVTVLKQFQEYVEPDEGLSSTVLAGLATPSQSRRPANQSVSTSDSDGATSSLGDNTLTLNLGIPIIVVLTKVCQRKSFGIQITQTENEFCCHTLTDLVEVTVRLC
jgi:hypothetical protein